MANIVCEETKKRWDEIMESVKAQREHEQEYLRERCREYAEESYTSGCDPWDM